MIVSTWKLKYNYCFLAPQLSSSFFLYSPLFLAPQYAPTWDGIVPMAPYNREKKICIKIYIENAKFSFRIYDEKRTFTYFGFGDVL